MQSGEAGLPKVMRMACNRPLLSYAVDALSFLPPEDIILIVGYRKEAVLDAFPAHPFAVQEQQLGTGHAVMSARELLADYSGSLLVCCGDMPLMRRETYEALIREHVRAGNVCTLLSALREISPTGGSCGRCGRFLAVVWDKTARRNRKPSGTQCRVYVFEAQSLFSV
jgi:bifunctional UDP-N-acetylglucosamine pyrophosphorylase/glucosamine-1-phosphate N-acetyltransferase/UDP-N-acetylglucosamine pyrophosphorylase